MDLPSSPPSTGNTPPSDSPDRLSQDSLTPKTAYPANSSIHDSPLNNTRQPRMMGPKVFDESPSGSSRQPQSTSSPNIQGPYEDPLMASPSPKPKPKAGTKRKPSVHFDEANILANSPTNKPSPKKARAIKNPIPRLKSTAKVQRALPIARSYEECEPYDKALIDMRDNGEPWDKVRKEWLRLTGEKATGKSTLPNRYMRLKVNFAHIEERDQALLIAAKQEIEDEMADEKWGRVAARMVEKETEEYLPEVLYIQWKKMMLDAQHLPAARENAYKKSKWQKAVDDEQTAWE